MKRHALLLATAFFNVAAAAAAERSLPLDSWTLEGTGRRAASGVLEVTGNGKDTSDWYGSYTFQPGGLYRFQVHARRPEGAGTIITGPVFANRDYIEVGSDWTWLEHVFRSPDQSVQGQVRVGLWEAKGSVQLDAVRLTPVVAVHRQVGPLVLGEGESIRNGQYEFSAAFDREGSNYHRPLISASAGFNSDRWCFGGDDHVTYRFRLPGRRFLSGEVDFTIGYYLRGGCLAEVSRDQKSWQSLVTQSALGTGRAKLPAELPPAETLFLRLKSTTADSVFQVHRVGFRGSLDGRTPEGVGRTLFADIDGASRDLALQGWTLSGIDVEGQPALLLELKNTSSQVLAADCRSEARFGGRILQHDQRSLSLSAGQVAPWSIRIPVAEPGRYELELAVKTGQGEVLRARVPVAVPEYYRADYGELFSGSSDAAALWWCDATHKIPRRRLLPKAAGAAATMSAARHDFEAVQIVVRPKETLRRLTATASPLRGPGGATIPADQIQILWACYHFVDHPTDAIGVRDLWPDALPPLVRPIDVPSGENQPLWVLVHVPRDARSGDYAGQVVLRADGWSASAPIRLHVWDFALPDKTHLETGYGLSADTIWRYHQAKSEADKRQVFDMYLKCLADHRLSPYQPAPLDPIRVKFLPDAKPPRAEVDFSAFDAAMSRVLEKYHFNSFVLPIEGMGGGTYQSRAEPQIGQYRENTPQYQAMFSSYVKQLEQHLREKGWLRMAYIYWFDEPDQKDFAFVRSGMERLHRYAPGLTRMLTKEPRDTLPGCVDLWCPISPQYDSQAAQQRRKHGERFWWYVCCGPKAPYCGLFIDHPATDLRVWNWQTWQRDIVGTLIWETVHWTSPTAFPDKPQNPYQDPMGYVADGSMPPGTKQYWGNGDGRFLYPPLSAAVPGLSGQDPVIEPPVSSIRLEMLREGVEDYEYLCILRERLAAHRAKLPMERVRRMEDLLQVPASITTEMTRFTNDPAPIYARRSQIAEAIESLGP